MNNHGFHEEAYQAFLKAASEKYNYIEKENLSCNSPKRDVQGGKKSVVKACKNGKEKLIRFGDANMTIKKNIPGRRKNFRARHNCDQKKDKFSAGYWSCKAW